MTKKRKFWNFTKSMADSSSGIADANATIKTAMPGNISGTVNLGFSGRSLSFNSSNGVLNSIYSKIAADISVYSIDYHRFDTSAGSDNSWLYDNLDPGLKRQLTYAPNPHQTISDFLRELTYTILNEGSAVIFFEEYLDGVLPDGLRSTLKVGTYNGIISPRTITSSDGAQVIKPCIEVRYVDDKTGQQVVSNNMPLENVVIINNPTNKKSMAPEMIIRALDQQISSLDMAVASGKNGGLLGFLKSKARNNVDEEQIKKYKARAQEIAEMAANGNAASVVQLFDDEEFIQLNRSLVPNNYESVSKLTEMIYGLMGIGKSIIDGTATDEELTQYRNGTLEPIRLAIERGLTNLLGYKAYYDGYRISLVVNKLSLLSPESIAKYSMGLVNGSIVSPDDINEYGLGLPRVGSLSSKRFNRNNKVSNAVTDNDTADGAVSPSDLDGAQEVDNTLDTSVGDDT